MALDPNIKQLVTLLLKDSGLGQNGGLGQGNIDLGSILGEQGVGALGGLAGTIWRSIKWSICRADTDVLANKYAKDGNLDASEIQAAMKQSGFQGSFESAKKYDAISNE